MFCGLFFGANPRSPGAPSGFLFDRFPPLCVKRGNSTPRKTSSAGARGFLITIRRRAVGKIDGAVAVAMAIGRALANEAGQSMNGRPLVRSRRPEFATCDRWGRLSSRV